MSTVYVLPPTRSRASITTTDAPARFSSLAAVRPLRPAPTTATSRSSLIVPRRGPEDDSLELADRVTAEPERGVEALAAELARVEPPPQLVQRREIPLGDLVTRRLEQDQVTRAAGLRREPREPLALFRGHPVRDDHGGLVRSQPLRRGRAQQLRRASVDLLVRYASCEQLAHLDGGKQSALLLDDAVGERLAVGLRRGRDQQ